MTLIFNLDLDNLTKVTNYGFDRKEHPFPTIYFRLYENGYDIDMGRFNYLRLRVEAHDGGFASSYNFSNVATINGEKLVEVKLEDNLLSTTRTLIITPTVYLKNPNKSIILKSFQFVIYEGSKTEMNMVKQGLTRFNHLYNLYIKAIKRDQINQPYGVVGLDKDARMSINQLPDNVGQHVQTKIRDSQIHGMRLNDEFMLEIYDKDDKKFYEANAISGGEFTYPNKEGKDVFGGFWGELDDLHNPTGEDISTEPIQGGKWNEYI